MIKSINFFVGCPTVGKTTALNRIQAQDDPTNFVYKDPYFSRSTLGLPCVNRLYNASRTYLDNQILILDHCSPDDKEINIYTDSTPFNGIIINAIFDGELPEVTTNFVLSEISTLKLEYLHLAQVNVKLLTLSDDELYHRTVSRFKGKTASFVEDRYKLYYKANAIWRLVGERLQNQTMR